MKLGRIVYIYWWQLTQNQGSSLSPYMNTWSIMEQTNMKQAI